MLGLSILFTKTIIGTLAALAWSIASIVCGLTPSSAATTITTISVIFAPRARISVNASWPGVSKNVIRWLLYGIWYAPVCWVIPPNSVSKILLFLIWSINVVFPWSTWPIIVTIGALLTKSFGSFTTFNLSNKFCASTTSSFLKSKSNSKQSSAISSSFNIAVIVLATFFFVKK